jgi:dual-specificity kinase
MHKSVDAKTRKKSVNMCLVFEPLGKSLYDFIKDNKYKGFDISDVREIARQSLKAIEFLHSIQLTHTDLKPENILLKSDKHEVVNDDTKIPIVSHLFCLT